MNDELLNHWKQNEETTPTQEKRSVDGIDFLLSVLLPFSPNGKLG